MLRVSCLLVFVLQSPLVCFAKDFTITLDVVNPAFNPNNGGPGDDDFDQTKPWQEWGTTGHDVANFLNNASSPIGAMWFKALNPGHTFAVNCSGGGLFREVWVNQARTEIIFRGVTTPVASGSYFWMKAVPPTGGGGEAYHQFAAKMYVTDPPIPVDGGWHQLPQTAGAMPSSCTKSVACCQPSYYCVPRGCWCGRRHRCRCW
jgi:hypothetical protein